MSEYKKIISIFGAKSHCLVIPIDIARKYGLDRGSNVVCEERPEGILIRKVTIQ
jgi:hypothetical protein